MPGIWQSSASFGAAFIAMQAYGVGPVWAHTIFLHQIVKNRHETLQIWCKRKHCQKAETIFVLPAFSTEEVNVGSSSTCDCCLGPGRPVLDPWQPNQVWKPGVKTCSSMKFVPFSFQSNRCFNSPEAVVYEYGANISDFWQARKPTIGSCWIPETFRRLGRFLERGCLRKDVGMWMLIRWSYFWGFLRSERSIQLFHGVPWQTDSNQQISFASKGFRFLRHVLIWSKGGDL